MTARPGFADRAVAFEIGRRDPDVDRAAIEKLRAAVLQLSAICLEAEKLAEAFPQLAVRSRAFSSIRGQLGLSWHELENAERAL